MPLCTHYETLIARRIDQSLSFRAEFARSTNALCILLHLVLWSATFARSTNALCTLSHPVWWSANFAHSTSAFCTLLQPPGEWLSPLMPYLRCHTYCRHAPNFRVVLMPYVYRYTWRTALTTTALCALLHLVVWRSAKFPRSTNALCTTLHQ